MQENRNWMRLRILKKKSCKRQRSNVSWKESKIDEAQFVKKTQITKIEKKRQWTR